MRSVIARLGLLFLAGALGMSLCDRVHLGYGVLVQRGPAILGQAWWVLPLFGGGGVAMVVGHHVVRRALGDPLRPRSVRALVGSTILGGLVYVVTGPLQHAKIALAVGLGAAWLVRAGLRRTPTALVASAVLGLAGPLVEATVARFGGHTYAHPDLFGVPLWLPGIYLHGALLAGDVEPWIFSEAPPGSSARTS